MIGQEVAVAWMFWLEVQVSAIVTTRGLIPVGRSGDRIERHEARQARLLMMPSGSLFIANLVTLKSQSSLWSEPMNFLDAIFNRINMTILRMGTEEWGIVGVSLVVVGFILMKGFGKDSRL